MTAAAIAGTFCTYRHVPSRGVVQLVIEIPVEHQAAAFEALGYPEPGKSLHVAVARLNNAQNADTISDNAHRREVMPVGPQQDKHDSTLDTPPSPQTLGAGADICEGGIDLSRLKMDEKCPKCGASMDEPCGAQGLPAVIAAQAAEGAASTGGGEDAGGRTQQPVPRHPQGSSTTAAPVVCNPVAPEGDENRGASCDHEYVRAGHDGWRCIRCGLLTVEWIDNEAKAKSAGARAVKRAGILCKEPGFQRWVESDISWRGVDDGASDEDDAAAYVRDRCQIASRRDLAHDERARERFEALVTEYVRSVARQDTGATRMTRTTSFLVGLMMVGLAAYVAIADPAENTIDQMAVPDAALTPGAVATDDLSDICGRVNGLTYTHRHRIWTSQAGTMSRYGLPLDEKKKYEDDDLVPVCLGGNNADPKNHWPQLWPEARVKDRMDAESCHLVCTGKMALPVARALFTPDWRKGYCRLYPEDTRC